MRYTELNRELDDIYTRASAIFHGRARALNHSPAVRDATAELPLSVSNPMPVGDALIMPMLLAFKSGIMVSRARIVEFHNDKTRGLSSIMPGGSRAIIMEKILRGSPVIPTWPILPASRRRTMAGSVFFGNLLKIGKFDVVTLQTGLYSQRQDGHNSRPRKRTVRAAEKSKLAFVILANFS